MKKQPPLKTFYPDDTALSYMVQALDETYTITYRDQFTGKTLTREADTLDEAETSSRKVDAELLAGLIRKYRNTVELLIKYSDTQRRSAKKAFELMTTAAFALEGVQKAIDELQPGLPAFSPELIMQATGTAGVALKDLNP